jgi:hypothetical protein
MKREGLEYMLDDLQNVYHTKKNVLNAKVKLGV